MTTNYCVYGDLPWDVYTASLSLRITDDSLLHWPMDPNDLPHTTIMYGPTINKDEPEITTADDADRVLSGFVSKYNGVMPEFTVTGVSYFDSNPKFNVVKIDFESQSMTEMQLYLRANTRNTYAEQYEQTKAPSYALPPVKWCHTTLGYLKKDAPVEDICKSLNEKVLGLFGGQTKKLTGIKLISAHTRTPIQLW